MRLKFVACAVLSAALALVAAPGFVGSQTPSPVHAIEAAAFQPLLSDASGATTSVVAPADPALRSANALDSSARFAEPLAGAVQVAPAASVVRTQPVPGLHDDDQAAQVRPQGLRQLLHNGTTAMRLPAGTVIRVCGASGCLNRVVNDYGPSAGYKPTRIIDMYEPDFFAICGCPSYSGTTLVTVSVY